MCGNVQNTDIIQWCRWKVPVNLYRAFSVVILALVVNAKNQNYKIPQQHQGRIKIFGAPRQ